ncbi:MAG: YkgJ family cysteine cluster protein [Desulfopila sp.]|jgi:Fe-S-cluster containining protein|nr:YkgJ family cysteine cluster protein [Desulfopila sp.]
MEKVFECKRCGYCCQGETTVSLSLSDQERMLDFLKLSYEEAIKQVWRCTDGIVQMQTVNGACIFYEDGCTVHPARPWRCREWPLVPAILAEENNLETIKRSCPGMGKDVTYESICKVIRDATDSKE